MRLRGVTVCILLGWLLAKIILHYWHPQHQHHLPPQRPTYGILEQLNTAPVVAAPPSPFQPLRTPHRASRTRELRRGPTDAQWAKLRQCENSGRYTSKPSDHYRGAYQFNRSTWKSVGGTGDPAQASPAEQDRRARLLYADRGTSPWPVCGRSLR